MNSIIYRCGWCGTPTEKNGNPLRYDTGFEKAKRILETYGDSHTQKLSGWCCEDVARAENCPELI